MAKTRQSVQAQTYRVTPTTSRTRSLPEVYGMFEPLKTRHEPSYLVRLKDGSEIFPEMRSTSGLCKPVKAVREGRRPEKPCFVKTLFVGARLAKKEGVEPGPYLISCNGSREPGYSPKQWIPITGRLDALETARDFCECRHGGGSQRKCAEETGRKTKRRRRR
jgi:hypothetical protein